MFTKGVNIKIGERDLLLVLNTEALAQIADQYGDTEKAIAEAEKSYSANIRIIPNLIAILATQGEAVRGSNEIITPQFISTFTMPGYFGELKDAFFEAYAIGMNIEVKPDDEDTDEVLSEIQKNALSATGN